MTYMQKGYIGLIDGEPDIKAKTTPELYGAYHSIEVFLEEKAVKELYKEYREINLLRADEVVKIPKWDVNV